ncbi:hypothetical protein FRC08_001299 [Ceratobasidium sp. 394]|nr:hypothetical protein FRC08_001299 [Ceratobasidium sp. 394]
MCTETFNQKPLASEDTTAKSSKRRRRGKTCLLTDADWYSEDYIQRSENLYRCLVCPRSAGFEWKDRNLMTQHQKTAMHYRFLELAKAKKLRERLSNRPRVVLYYPTVSPEEPIGNAIPVFYEPEWLTDCQRSAGSAGTSDVSVSPRGKLELLEEEDFMEGKISRFDP